MATTKKTVKVRDLKPAKDAKGGHGHFKPQNTKPNTTKPAGHHGHANN